MTLKEMENEAKEIFFKCQRSGWDVPLEIIESLLRYSDFGIPTGGFLAAVLANDLMDATGRADSQNRPRIADIACMIYNYFPHSCHGSRETVQSWLLSFRNHPNESGELISPDIQNEDDARLSDR